VSRIPADEQQDRDRGLLAQQGDDPPERAGRAAPAGHDRRQGQHVHRALDLVELGPALASGLDPVGRPAVPRGQLFVLGELVSVAGPGGDGECHDLDQGGGKGFLQRLRVLVEGQQGLRLMARHGEELAEVSEPGDLLPQRLAKARVELFEE
jgi:hypothetical protein